MNTGSGAIFESLLAIGVRLLLVVIVIAAFTVRIALGAGARQLARFAASRLVRAEEP
jgi:hypothetical protein